MRDRIPVETNSAVVQDNSKLVSLGIGQVVLKIPPLRNWAGRR